MATYRLSVKLISRSVGRSATAAAAYRAGSRIHDERSGLTFDYRRRDDVLDRAIYAPENAPYWVADRARLWNEVELAEKRRDAQVAREIQVSLPCELSLAVSRELLRAFVARECVARGMVADVTIHAAHKGSDTRNIHGHILLSTRRIEANGFGDKERSWNDRAVLDGWRAAWEVEVNRALELARIEARVSHLSYRRLEVDLEPEPKQGPIATKMERQGRESRAGRDRRAVRERNKRRDLLRRLAHRLDKKIVAEEQHQHRLGREGYDSQSGHASPPSISSPEHNRSQLWREQVLSDYYASDLRASSLARFWRIERTAKGIVFANARGRFVDEGSLITATRGNDLEVRGMLDAARAHGWSELLISGADDFIRRAMRAALNRGFTIVANGRDAELLQQAALSARENRSSAHERAVEAGYDR